LHDISKKIKVEHGMIKMIKVKYTGPIIDGKYRVVKWIDVTFSQKPMITFDENEQSMKMLVGRNEYGKKVIIEDGKSYVIEINAFGEFTKKEVEDGEEGDEEMEDDDQNDDEDEEDGEDDGEEIPFPEPDPEPVPEPEPEPHTP
jgi:hypothetical protein